jgi:hypothetical protein
MEDIPEDIHKEKIDKMKKNIVFVTSKESIDSAISLSQYIYNGVILFTFIGELHKEIFKCDEPSISIATYCRNAAERNPNCRIMLEYGSRDDLNKLSDCTIKETFECLKKLEIESGRSSQVIPFDERPIIIGRDKQYDLYWADWSSFDTHTYGNEYDYISKWYVKPFFDKLECVNDQGLVKLLPERLFLNRDSHTHLVSYHKSLIQKFKFIKTLIEQKKSIEKSQTIDESLIEHKKSIAEIKRLLQIYWAQVADFYVLKKLFIPSPSNPNIDEYIVLMGEYHKRNITDFINSFSKSKDLYYNLVDQNKNIDKDGKVVCVNIFTTYTFYS